MSPSDRAHAGVHVCASPDGSKQFQDRPCAITPPGSPRRSTGSLHRADARRAKSVRSTPERIDPSWLEAPERSAYQAYCDRRGCECGPRERVFTDVTVAVADALFIDGAWMHYDNSVAALDDAASPADSFKARSGLDEASCELMMSQRTLALFARSTFDRLRQRTREPARDLAVLQQRCDRNEGTACALLDAHMLHERMTLDLQALERPRPGSVSH